MASRPLLVAAPGHRLDRLERRGQGRGRPSQRRAVCECGEPTGWTTAQGAVDAWRAHAGVPARPGGR